jgi:hypothetical protein
MPLPKSVSPGDLITADLLNAILAAIESLQRQSSDVTKTIASLQSEYAQIHGDLTALQAEVTIIQAEVALIKSRLSWPGLANTGVGGDLKGLINTMKVEEIKGLEQADKDLLGSLGITTADTLVSPSFQLGAIQFPDDATRQRIENVVNGLRAVAGR